MQSQNNSHEKVPNRLIHEKSPYLLQHAYNPVDWYPWGPEAFETAVREDKPVFLSIGYSTCHWCHVMEKETFDDYVTARLLNDTFVCIKVDREERPDIDSVYMKMCQMMTGSGGWPLNIVMTPDKKPFFAATYIPREDRLGRTGIKRLIKNVRKNWHTNRQELINSAERVDSLLRESLRQKGKLRTVDLDRSILDEVFIHLLSEFDELNGGFGKAPKFPIFHRVNFLLRYWKRTRKKKALQIIEKTLDAMMLGGIYDHVGFGFHRYSTDSRWRIPHFEKMLYDQALATLAYLEAYQATGKEEYKKTAHEVLTYVLRDMTAQEGGFFSAEDADSEGEEGKFYLWTEDEVKNVLGKPEADLFMEIFGIEKHGNYGNEISEAYNGKNVLCRTIPMKLVSSVLDVPAEILQERLERSRARLFEARERRIHPSKDQKIISSWNGLMIAALGKASQVFNDKRYCEAAEKAADFIMKELIDKEGRLYHSYKDGRSLIPAFLDDYAFFTWGLIEIYEAIFEVDYLQKAAMLTNDMIKHFWDVKKGGFFFTADDAEVVVREKSSYDAALPSGNSLALMNMLRLARLTSRSDLEEKAASMTKTFSNTILEAPAAHTQFISAFNFALGPTYEVIVVGEPQKNETQAMLQAIKSRFIPNMVLLFLPIDGDLPEFWSEFTDRFISKERRVTTYVCKNYKCSLPTTSIDETLQLLDEE